MGVVTTLQSAFNNVRGYFRQKREQEAARKTALSLIARRDATALRALLETDPLNKNDHNEVIDTAVRFGDLDTFKAVFQTVAKSDPNYVLSHDYDDEADDEAGCHAETPLIYTAIKANRDDTAAYLAGLPGIDLTDMGYVERSYPSELGTTDDAVTNPNALLLVRGTDLHKTHSIIAARFAADRTQEAERLTEESRKYAPPSPV